VSALSAGATPLRLALVADADRSLADIEAVLASTLHRERSTVIDIGKLLIEAKRKVEHGQWMLWLAQHFGKSDRTAQNYMRAAEWASKNATVADLKLRPSALYWLSGDNGIGNYQFQMKRNEFEPMARDEAEAEILALAKTKWVDREDCVYLFEKAVCRRVVARDKAKSEEHRIRRKAENKAAEAAGIVRTITLTPVASPTPPEPEQYGPPVPKRVRVENDRRKNLNGMVNAIIKLSPHIDDLVGAVEPETLEKLVEFCKALVNRSAGGGSRVTACTISET